MLLGIQTLPVQILSRAKIMHLIHSSKTRIMVVLIACIMTTGKHMFSRLRRCTMRRHNILRRPLMTSLNAHTLRTFFIRVVTNNIFFLRFGHGDIPMRLNSKWKQFDTIKIAGCDFFYYVLTVIEMSNPLLDELNISNTYIKYRAII
jgi:hypothetical protein